MTEERKLIADLPLLNVSEVFSSHRPPTLVCGASGSGKTVMMIDAIRTNASTATRIIVITNAYSTRENMYLKNQIPIHFVREFDVQALSDIWNMIMQEQDEYTRYTSQDIITEFVANHCQVDEYIGCMRQIQNVQSQLLTIMPEGIDTDSALTHLIWDFSMEYIAKSFWAGSEGLTEEELRVVSACRSTPPHPMIYIDDVSSELQRIKTSRTKITLRRTYESHIMEEEFSEKAAADNLLLNIMTKGRQYAEVALFVHNFNILDSRVRQGAGAIVINSSTDAAELRRIRTFGPETNQADVLFSQVSEIPGYYKLVYFPQLSYSPSGTNYGVVQADLYESPIELGCPNLIYQMRLLCHYLHIAEEEVACGE